MKEFNTTRCPLRVYGVPCNQFGLQEPGDGVEILNSVKYVRPGNGFEPRFDLLVKRQINGAKEDELFKWLKVRAEDLCHWKIFRYEPYLTAIQFVGGRLKWHCNEKIVNSILIVKEQHLQIRLNGVFSFSISCFASEIFRFLKHAN